MDRAAGGWGMGGVVGLIWNGCVLEKKQLTLEV